MKVGIVEDEKLTAERLISMINRYDPSIEIQFLVDSNTNLQQTLLNHSHPDLLFSDIELLDGDVFQSYRKVDPQCPIIFTTAFDKYWLDAFQENGISYLLKPFNQAQLAQAMEKYKKLRTGLAHFSTETLRQQWSKSGQTQTSYKKRFVVKRHKGIEVLSVNDISLIKVEINSVYAFDFEGKRYPLSEPSLTQVASKLNPDVFFQLNRNEIISIEAIERLEPEIKDRLAIKVKGYAEKLVVSAQRTPEFRVWLDR